MLAGYIAVLVARWKLATSKLRKSEARQHREQTHARRRYLDVIEDDNHGNYAVVSWWGAGDRPC